MFRFKGFKIMDLNKPYKKALAEKWMRPSSKIFTLRIGHYLIWRIKK